MNETDILNELLEDYATVPVKTEADTSAPAEEKEADAVQEQTVPPAAKEEIEPTELPQEQEALLTEAVSDDTMVLPTVDEAETPIVVSAFDAPTQVIRLEKEEEPAEDEFDGQMTMADFVEEEPVPVDEAETETAEEISWEEQLEQTRREKIRDFQIQQNREETDFRYAEEQAPDELPTPVPAVETSAPPKKKFTGDYTEQAQAADVAAELQYRCRSLKFRLWLALVAEIVLLCSEATVLYYGVPTVAPTLFLLLNMAGFGAMIGLLFPMLRDGLTALVKRNPNTETISLLVATATALHTLLQWCRLGAVETGEAPLLTAVAGLLLLLYGWGRLLRVSRINRNFALVGSEGEKVAAAVVQEERAAVEIGRRAVAVGVPRVVYFRKVRFLDSFLANSYMNDRYDAFVKRYIPAASALALVGGVVGGIVTASFWNGLFLCAAFLCVLLPSVSLALNLPLWRECRNQLRYGNMLCGFAAAERFGKVHGVALDVSDIYLQDSVMLHGIRTFGATRIDEAITDAATVAIRTEGPLAGLFMRIIEGKTEILQEADNLVFEQDMGFSGWVGGRRVLVGNRKLLENHGVDTPSGDYEAKYKKNGRELVYLSVAGELSAMFVISYMTDETVEGSLHALQDAGVSLLVRSCDPNVTEQSLCEGFRLDDFYLDLLNASAGRIYDSLTHQEVDSLSAGAAVKGSVESIAALLTGCKRLRRRVLTAVTVLGLCALCSALICFAVAVSGAPLGALPLVFILLTALFTIIAGTF